MKGVNAIYLGWDNPRNAYRVAGHDIAILIKDSKNSVVLQDDKARAFLKDIVDLNHHLCGICKSTNARQILDKVDPDPHQVNAYNFVFDKHWDGV